MPWCPNCKMEYRDGITHCSDCKEELVHELQPDTPLLFGEEHMLLAIQSYLKDCGFDSTGVVYIEEEGLFELYGNKKQEDAMKRAITLYLQEAAKEQALLEEDDVEDKKVRGAGVYVRSKDRAKDVYSSAITLWVVGILGILILVLQYVGVISFGLSALGEVLMYLVMGILFAVFLVMGTHSYISAKRLSLQAIVEEKREEDLFAYAMANYVPTYEFDADTSEEVQYFQRMSSIKDFILQYDSTMEESFCDYMAEKIDNARQEMS